MATYLDLLVCDGLRLTNPGMDGTQNSPSHVVAIPTDAENQSKETILIVGASNVNVAARFFVTRTPLLCDHVRVRMFSMAVWTTTSLHSYRKRW